MRTATLPSGLRLVATAVPPGSELVRIHQGSLLGYEAMTVVTPGEGGRVLHLSGWIGKPLSPIEWIAARDAFYPAAAAIDFERLKPGGLSYRRLVLEGLDANDCFCRIVNRPPKLSRRGVRTRASLRVLRSCERVSRPLTPAQKRGSGGWSIRRAGQKFTLPSRRNRRAIVSRTVSANGRSNLNPVSVPVDQAARAPKGPRLGMVITTRSFTANLHCICSKQPVRDRSRISAA